MPEIYAYTKTNKSSLEELITFNESQIFICLMTNRLGTAILMNSFIVI